MAVRFLLALCCAVIPGLAQVDQTLAAKYFKEAEGLCKRENGKIWGVSLCGPMVIADPMTQSIATNQPIPEAKRPALLGFANTALDWGGTRWSTFVWQIIPRNDEYRRGVLILHELFHRVQPQLNLLGPDGSNDHLDTVEGRFWLQLEWRALAKALGTIGDTRAAAVRDALAFRAARHKRFPGSAESERRMEINEGLAQYTGTIAGATLENDAVSSAIAQLQEVVRNETFVRTFPYPSGAAYGILLDSWSPGWPRRVKVTDNLGDLLARAARISPDSVDPSSAAMSYGSLALRAAEVKRDADRQALLASLRKRFVEGPVLVLPRPRTSSFTTAGMTPVPGEGLVYQTFRGSDEWGTVAADVALVSNESVRLPGPPIFAGQNVTGDRWTVKVAEGWAVRPGDRPGDFQVVKE
jgi:hypothetical protein